MKENVACYIKYGYAVMCYVTNVKLVTEAKQLLQFLFALKNELFSKNIATKNNYICIKNAYTYIKRWNDQYSSI